MLMPKTGAQMLMVQGNERLHSLITGTRETTEGYCSNTEIRSYLPFTTNAKLEFSLAQAEIN
jgi:hypothetical protein